MKRRTTALFCSVDISEPPVTLLGAITPCPEGRSRHLAQHDGLATVWGRRPGGTSRSLPPPGSAEYACAAGEAAAGQRVVAEGETAAGRRLRAPLIVFARPPRQSPMRW